MRHLKKSFIILGILWMVFINKTKCSVLKIKDKKHNNRDKICPYNTKLGSCKNRVNSSMNAVASEPLLEQNKNSDEHNLVIDIKIDLVPSTTINSINTRLGHNSKKNCILREYKNENKYNIRNFTSYIEDIENVVFFRSNKKCPQDPIKKRSVAIINKWKKNSKTNIWFMAQSLTPVFFRRFYFLNDIIKTNPSDLGTITNPLYYDGFLEDLVKYIKMHGQRVYTYKEAQIRSYKFKKETLGDIWLNKEINIYCCCCGIDMQMATKETEEGIKEDEKFKNKLNTIFYIPEVYEDFYKLPLKEVSKFFFHIEEDLNKTIKIVDALNDRYKSIKELLGLKPIILYLISTAQKDTVQIEIFYNQIKELKVNSDHSRPINTFNSIEIYYLVHNAVYIFYIHYTLMYKLDKESKQAIKSRTPLLHIYSIHPNRMYSKIMGGPTTLVPRYLKFSTELTRVNKIENGQFDSDVLRLHRTNYAYIKENNTILSIKDHYHIQFVDNERHTVEMIHLPLYLHKKDNGDSLVYFFHTIRCIVLYLKMLFRIGENRKHGMVGNIYPFKYNRKDCTWSLITENSDLDRTVQIIEEENCNVVFYYIKENIYLEEFCFAQFIYPDHIQDEVKDDNINKPRIPLFLSKLMVSGAFLGPYDEYSLNYDVFRLMDYKNLKPIEYIQTYTKNYRIKPLFDIDGYNHELLLLNNHTGESTLNYAIKHYYSDFFIKNSTDPYEDFRCYYMNIQQKINKETGNVTIHWNAREYSSVYEYTIYSFDSDIKDERAHMSAVNQPAHASFIDMLQRKNPSLDMAMYGHCFYKNSTDADYNNNPLFCLTMKDLLERLNAYLVDLNKKDKILDIISRAILFNKKYSKKFILKDISEMIQSTKLEEIKESKEGVISIRDNNYNGCKYGIHYDILKLFANNKYISSDMRVFDEYMHTKYMASSSVYEEAK
ncbi:hypothetical protein NEPAR06_0601 [Nematocida parisii]|nr:hypothetical protein NEPAR03_2446 [Nematocida parisii]KAI5131507.1 hypothetical protein NEPAR08_2485 [Nematocida parisii]KAI5145525.1 hypothetical protein NEPAR04_2472 [Nematocida parisii]KAI5153607.1 hypothetical protein NEPAR06_0601 [Nematocida parisii]KAI5159033.1 hypothetical protein NEPAR05_2373 [Nematocida parisii]